MKREFFDGAGPTILLWGLSVLGGCGGGVVPQSYLYAAFVARIIGAERQAGDILPPARSPTLSATRQRTGQELFQRMCQECHGANGKGEEKRFTLPLLPDFTDTGWHRGREDKQLVVSIQRGRGRDMPAFQGKLTENQLRDLVAHVRRFAPESRSSARDESPTEDFQQRFHELQKELEELKSQFYELHGRPKKSG